MTRMITLQEQLAAFVGSHEHVVLNALQHQAEYMDTEAAKAAATAEQMSDEEPVPNGDGKTVTLIPTRTAMAHIAGLFRDSAGAARKAYEAFEKLAERAEEEV
jgi:hypothetical protein